MDPAATATEYWIQSTMNWSQALCPLPLDPFEDYYLEQEKRPLMNRYELALPPQDSASDMDDPVSEFSDIASSVPSSESWQSLSDDPCSEQYSQYMAPSFSTYGFTRNVSLQMTSFFHSPQGPEPPDVDENPAGFTPGMFLNRIFNGTLSCWYGPLSHADSYGYFGNLDYWTLPRLAIDMPYLAHDGGVLNKYVASAGENITRNSSADSDRTTAYMDTPGPSAQSLLGPSTVPQELLGGPHQTFGHPIPASPVPDPPQAWTCPVEGCTKTLNQRHKFNKHVKSHDRLYACHYRSCAFAAYQKKDMNRHIEAVHRKAKIPCPVVNCRYSKDGPRRGISRKDALKRHLASHGLTADSFTLSDDPEHQQPGQPTMATPPGYDST